MKMNPFLRAAWCGLITAMASGHCSSAADAPATNRSAAETMIQDFLVQEAVRLDVRFDARFVEGANSRAQWEAKRSERHREYMEMLGLWPLPERTPLEARVTGVLEREGFRVENLHFQSRPHLYVTGNLYLPKDAKPGAKLPAVLYVCGHSGRGREGNKTAFQHHGMWFATHGYVCLVIDTLQLGEIAGIHHGTYRYDRWWWQARGYTPAGVECWNGMRALDYLQSRSEVDPDRLAVTGISGGGAATFWIAAADERVKVAVPVSGMSDLEDYVGGKVVNGHCDCMFLLNTFQWPWTQIAALVAPRPLLFANSGHDTIFPMTGNERIRARLERLYGYYTNRTDRLFDIAVTPGGHDDNPELRLMAYRWINRFLKNDNSPVTEPDLPKIEGKLLRAFPDELPADELNTKIDEVFVPAATNARPQTLEAFQSWRETTLRELRRIVFAGATADRPANAGLKFNPREPASGTLTSAPGIRVPWAYFPATNGGAVATIWFVVLSGDESVASRPDWLKRAVGDKPALLVGPRNTGSLRWDDPPPFYIQRALPLVGRTVDRCRLDDVLAAVNQVLAVPGDSQVRIIGRGAAGIIAAYTALLEPRLAEAMVVDPPSSHREGPIFLNVLRVIDIPEALGLLAPRPLTIWSAQPAAFEATLSLYEVAGGRLEIIAWP
jgi:cephalosporin-C deacetylase-like acetyl esterase